MSHHLTDQAAEARGKPAGCPQTAEHRSSGTARDACLLGSGLPSSLQKAPWPFRPLGMEEGPTLGLLKSYHWEPQEQPRETPVWVPVCRAGMRGREGARPRTRVGHPSGWNATPLSSFPSSTVLSLDTRSVYFFLPAAKFCTPPECGGS